MVFKNLRRAGTLKNRFSTITVVPVLPPLAVTSVFSPPSIWTEVANSSLSGRVSSVKLETEAILGKASPRKPKVFRLSKSSAFVSLLVAWRNTAILASASLMPQPLSVTLIYSVPPAKIVTSILSAPASSAFSTNSFTTDAGFSTTSPAAIWLAVFVSNNRTACSSAIIYPAPFLLHPAIYTRRSSPQSVSCS